MFLKSFNDGHLFGRVHGTYPPRVLALHGWGRTSADFDRVLSGLDAIALDLPGFGASPEPDEALGAWGYAEEIVGVVGSLPQPPLVVGHSFGGRVALNLAAHRPDLVGHLVLTGVPLLRVAHRRPGLGYRVIRSAGRAGLIPASWLESLRQRRGSADYRAARGVMRDVLVKTVNESYEVEMGMLGGPVTLVWGADDSEAPLDMAERAVELMSRGELIVLRGVGHMLPLEAPEMLRSVIIERLS